MDLVHSDKCGAVLRVIVGFGKAFWKPEMPKRGQLRSNL